MLKKLMITAAIYMGIFQHIYAMEDNKGFMFTDERSGHTYYYSHPIPKEQEEQQQKNQNTKNNVNNNGQNQVNNESWFSWGVGKVMTVASVAAFIYVLPTFEEELNRKNGMENLNRRR